MVSERMAYASLLLVMLVGMGLILYGMYLSAGQALNGPAIVGGVVLIAGLAAMTYATTSVFAMQEEPSYGHE